MTTDLDVMLPAIAQGDAAAFGRFATAIELDLRRSLRGFATRVDVEAVVQEALLRTWQVAPRFVPDGKPNGLARLATRIARNAALDDLRRRRETTTADAVDDVPDVTVAEPDPMLRAHVVLCLESLHERARTVLLLRIGSRGIERDADLAARASMTLNTFLQNVTRARRSLETCLEGRGVFASEVVK